MLPRYEQVILNGEKGKIVPAISGIKSAERRISNMTNHACTQPVQPNKRAQFRMASDSLNDGRVVAAAL